MRQQALTILLLVLVAAGTVPAQEETPEAQTAAEEAQNQTASTGIAIEDASVALKVENRAAVGAGNVFPTDVGELACFTKVVGAKGDTFITHVWKHGDTERMRRNLNVKSSSWRTYSVKTIDPAWTGAWTVEVLDAEGQVLKTLSFTIQ